MKEIHATTYFDCYRTTFNRHVLIDEIASKISNGFVHRSRFPSIAIDSKSFKLLNGIIPITSLDTDTPSLAHPFILDKNPNQNSNVYIDIRSVSRINPHEETLFISNESAFNIIRWRANLVRYSLVKSKSDIWETANFTAGIYASWLSEALSRRFSLDLSVSAKILVVAAIFYNSLFNGVSILATEESCRKLTLSTTRRLGRIVQDPSLVEGVVDTLSNLPNLGGFNTLDDLVLAIKAVTDNIRLTNLSAKQVLEATSFGWYGSDSAQLCATALEDPATFITLCVIGHENQNYHKTAIGLLVKRRASDMSRSIEGLVNEINTVPF
jgi:hypothetical protein